MKNILILFSGGLDSTYLVYNELKKGNKVTLSYIKIKNNQLKSKNELESITNIVNELKKEFSPEMVIFDKNKRNSINILTNYGEFSLPQIPLFMMNLCYTLNDSIDEVLIGAVMNDDMVSYKKKIKKFYKSLLNMMELKSKPKLKFPLIEMKKWRILEKLPKNIISLITTCENPEENGNACGKCCPCKKIYADGLYVHPQYEEIRKTHFKILKDIYEGDELSEKRETTIAELPTEID